MEGFLQEIARQRQKDLLDVAERYRLARIGRDSKTPHRPPGMAHAESKQIPSHTTAAVSGRPAR